MSGSKIEGLLKWSAQMTRDYNGVAITNMTTSWRNGLAFCALIHKFRPDLIDFDLLSKENVYHNNSLAFSIAEKELGIPALLDAEDMVALTVPDRLSIITYVSQYYNYYTRNKVVLMESTALGLEDEATPEAQKRPATTAVSTPTKKVPGVLPAVIPPANPNMCTVCHKPVYIVEKVVVEGKLFHRLCFRCHICQRVLKGAIYFYDSSSSTFLCETHHKSMMEVPSVSLSPDFMGMEPPVQDSPPINHAAATEPSDDTRKLGVEVLKKNLSIIMKKSFGLTKPSGMKTSAVPLSSTSAQDTAEKGSCPAANCPAGAVGFPPPKHSHRFNQAGHLSDPFDSDIKRADWVLPSFTRPIRQRSNSAHASSHPERSPDPADVSRSAHPLKVSHVETLQRTSSATLSRHHAVGGSTSTENHDAQTIGSLVYIDQSVEIEHNHSKSEHSSTSESGKHHDGHFPAEPDVSLKSAPVLAQHVALTIPRRPSVAPKTDYPLLQHEASTIPDPWPGDPHDTDHHTERSSASCPADDGVLGGNCLGGSISAQSPIHGGSENSTGSEDHRESQGDVTSLSPVQVIRVLLPTVGPRPPRPPKSLLSNLPPGSREMSFMQGAATDRVAPGTDPRVLEDDAGVTVGTQSCGPAVLPMTAPSPKPMADATFPRGAGKCFRGGGCNKPDTPPKRALSVPSALPSQRSVDSQQHAALVGVQSGTPLTLGTSGITLENGPSDGDVLGLPIACKPGPCPSQFSGRSSVQLTPSLVRPNARDPVATPVQRSSSDRMSDAVTADNRDCLQLSWSLHNASPENRSEADCTNEHTRLQIEGCAQDVAADSQGADSSKPNQTMALSSATVPGHQEPYAVLPACSNTNGLSPIGLMQSCELLPEHGTVDSAEPPRSTLVDLQSVTGLGLTPLYTSGPLELKMSSSPILSSSTGLSFDAEQRDVPGSFLKPAHDGHSCESSEGDRNVSRPLPLARPVDKDHLKTAGASSGASASVELRPAVTYTPDASLRRPRRKTASLNPFLDDSCSDSSDGSDENIEPDRTSNENVLKKEPVLMQRTWSQMPATVTPEPGRQACKPDLCVPHRPPKPAKGYLTYAKKTAPSPPTQQPDVTSASHPTSGSSISNATAHYTGNTLAQPLPKTGSAFSQSPSQPPTNVCLPRSSPLISTESSRISTVQTSSSGTVTTCQSKEPGQSVSPTPKRPLPPRKSKQHEDKPSTLQPRPLPPAAALCNNMSSSLFVKRRAPPPPKRDPVTPETLVEGEAPTRQSIEQELEKLEKQQQLLEVKGVDLEKTLRQNTGDGNEVELASWLTLINERNELVQRENELMSMLAEISYMEEQNRIAAEIRSMHADDGGLEKSPEMTEKESALVQQLLHLVNLRARIVEQAEEDRLRSLPPSHSNRLVPSGIIKEAARKNGKDRTSQGKSRKSEKASSTFYVS